MDDTKNEHEVTIITDQDEKSTKDNSIVSTDLVGTKVIDKKSDENNYLEMLKRLKAEFENYKKRVEKENAELSTLIKSQLIYNLLPVIDDFERMFNYSPVDIEEVIKGSKLIYEKLMTILTDEGLQRIESVGKDFDPEIHEAVLVESGEDDFDNNILEELQKGYIFKTKLLRPAKVKVYKTAM